MKTWSLYAIVVPSSCEAYIGQTCRPIAKRWREHQRYAHNGRSSQAVHRWLAEHLKEATLELLDVASSQEDANTRERFWIQAYPGMGFALLNQTEGGSPEVTEQRCQALRMAMARPETKAKKAVAGRQVATATWKDPVEREKKIAGMKRSWTPERKARMAALRADPEWMARWKARNKEAQNRPERKAQQSLHMKEYANRSEVRARVSAQSTALWSDPERRAKQIAAIAAGRWGRS